VRIPIPCEEDCFRQESTAGLATVPGDGIPFMWNGINGERKRLWGE